MKFLIVCLSVPRSAVQRQVPAVPLLDGRRERGMRRSDGCRCGPGADGAERCARLSGAKGARRDDASHSEEAVSYFDSESCRSILFILRWCQNAREDRRRLGDHLRGAAAHQGAVPSVQLG